MSEFGGRVGYEGGVWVTRVEVPMVAEWVDNGALGQAAVWWCLMRGGVHLEEVGLVQAQ